MNINLKNRFYLFFFCFKKGEKMKKKPLLVIFTIVILTIVIIFIKMNYKNFKIGNNESNKSVNEVKEYILNLNSYTAQLDVTITSNKNTNKYILKQECNNQTQKQTVVKPENIEGTEISYKDGSLEISNSKLNLSKIYSNYPYLSENVLWLNSFIEVFKQNSENSEVYEENEYIVMQVSLKNEKYFAVRKLYLEKGTGKPKKMIVQDNNKNEIIYILYTEIDVNK